MKTLTFEFYKGGVAMLKGILAMLIIGLFLMIYSFGAVPEFQDVEKFDWRRTFFTLAILLLILKSLKEYIDIQKARKLWGSEKNTILEVPFEEITGLHAARFGLGLQTKNHDFKYKNFCIKNYKKLRADYPENYSYDLKKQFKSNFKKVEIFIFAILMMVMASTMGAWSGSKYNLKYYLPIPKVETVEVSGILSKEPYIYITPNGYSHLISLKLEGIDDSFEYVSPRKLADQTFDSFGVKNLPEGAEVILKIRKEDEKKFRKANSENARGKTKLNFYGLKVDEVVILQKLGINEQ